MTDLTSMNPPQREAVEHVDGPLLVFAGAGSGKTRVITLRTAGLVLTHGVEPQRILLVTFTNKAATEMKERLGVLLGPARVKRMWVGTFHAIGARILRVHAEAVGRRRDFVIYDDGDQETVVKQIFGEMKIDKKMVSPSKMLSRIQDAKQKGYGPAEVPQLDPESTQFAEVWEKYETWMRACNAMDFEDLILLTMRLAEGSHPAIGAMLRSSFDHVLVDEFQDTNFTQYRLVKALARASGNLCVVGDDDQCLAADTEVMVGPPGYTKRIAEIVPGDYVESCTPTRSLTRNRVMAVTTTRATEAMDVTIRLPPSWDALTWTSRLRCTPNHLIYAAEAMPGAWSPPVAYVPVSENLRDRMVRPESVSWSAVRAQYLPAEASLIYADKKNGCMRSGRVTSVVASPTDELFYDLSLEDTSIPNFFANGWLVHNCIYTWRGADPRNIRDFQTEWPRSKVVRLEQNYRSTKRIVAVAVGVIEKNLLRAPKTLWTDNAAGSEVEIVENVSDRAEADVVCARIRAHIAKGGKARDCAILYRTHTQSRAIEDQLRDWQVPYKIVGGHRFYDRKEVKDVLAYLRLLSNPHSDVDILRVLNVPARGLGPTTLKRLSEIASAYRVGLWEALPHAAAAAEIGRREQMQLANFRTVIEEYQKLTVTTRPSELCAKLVEGVGYRKMWEHEVKKLKQEGKLSEAEAAQERVENMDELVNAIASYEQRASDDGEAPSLRGYLEVVSLAAEEQKDERSDRVPLMTVHASKGLEFDRVFIVGFEEGRFPIKNVDVNPRELEEERRIAYVAITRARTHLTITLSRLRWVHGQCEDCMPSRFLADMPGGSVRRGPDRPPSPANHKEGWL